MNKIGTCESCKEERKIIARNLCQSCYHRLRRHGDPGFRKYKQPKEPCNVRGCSRPANIQGLYPGMCPGHVDQMRRGKPLRTIKVTDLDEDGMKQCRKCGDWYPEDEVWVRNRTRCNRCMKDEYLRRDHGISLETYENMYERQGGACMICGSFQEVLDVDHDHGCCPLNENGKSVGGCGNCVRGLLCTRCNTTMGRVNDDVQLLQNMINYLQTN